MVIQIDGDSLKQSPNTKTMDTQTIDYEELLEEPPAQSNDEAI